MRFKGNVNLLLALDIYNGWHFIFFSNNLYFSQVRFYWYMTRVLETFSWRQHSCSQVATQDIVLEFLQQWTKEIN